MNREIVRWAYRCFAHYEIMSMKITYADEVCVCWSFGDNDNRDLVVTRKNGTWTDFVNV